MSLDATNWAWRVKFPEKAGSALPALKLVVLLSMADRASEDHTCFPSINRLASDCRMNRKSVIKIIAELIEDGLISDTGERKGRTKQVIVYRLNGVNGREETVPTTKPLDDENLDGNSPKDGTVPTVEQFQQFTQTVPTIPLNSPNVGTRNLLINLSEESKNNKNWLSLKILKEELCLATDQETFELIKNATWFEREKRAFELFNADKNLCVELLHYHFADWLINAVYKYQSRQQAIPHTPKNGKSSNSQTLSDKQITAFSQKLAHHPEFAGFFAYAGESYEQLAARIAVKLSDPAQAKQWERYLKQVGFKGSLQGAA
ncbi:helix-turn-helix domain-containing protein [uncultured Acinetobacter sp.]|uniref:helix-turn-helix domain-containing protein n=1 Tax=uncultured Acinetobacter sp. TaxID=165433 RepID=UPI002589CB0D|nr:helix-turn-helix domain-containing protein [uncultured Acinetobacter sp.]